MGLELSYRECKRCGAVVELNGCGSTSNIWMRGLTNAINALYPISQKLFRHASDNHDLAYHQGLKGKRNQADEMFLSDCMGAIETPEAVVLYLKYEREKGFKVSQLSTFDLFLIKNARWWFRYQAKKYYEALKLGGDACYPKVDCTCESRH